MEAFSPKKELVNYRKELKDTTSQKNALVKILLPARILKKYIERHIKSINVEISCAVLLSDKEKSGECDMIVTKIKRDQYGIFKQKPEILIEIENGMPSRAGFKSLIKKIDERLKYAYNTMVVVLVNSRPAKKHFKDKSFKTYEEKCEKLNNLPNTKVYTVELDKYDNENDLEYLVNDICKILRK